MRYLVPAAVIALAILAFVAGRGEDGCLVAFVGGHLLAPLWAGLLAPRGGRARAIALGPGLIIAAHLVVIAVLWLILLGGPPEDTWINYMLLMIWLGALAAYAVYCAIVLSLCAAARR